MASKTIFTVQAFRLNRGQLIPGKREEAPSEHGAIKKAAAWAARELGVAALKIVADDEGQVSEAVILAQHEAASSADTAVRRS